MNLLFSSVWRKKVWQMNRSAKWLLILTTILDGFWLGELQIIRHIRQTFYPPTNYTVLAEFLFGTAKLMIMYTNYCMVILAA